ncbi:MAG: septum formation initiator family protein [Albidovulum sp.]|nr:septum formation initiator family protein [Albidovulum sp.]MDE0306501.1 septum formation initiator family protein [Albidovulum sp.]MDE0531240.1 septum formation initiator family protein [Albidovulum sp.]
MIKKLVKPAWGAVAYAICVISASAYLVFEAVQGEYGMASRLRALDEESELKETLRELEYEYDILANKTDRLSDSNLDLDLLDERARAVLGMVRNDEFIVN